MQNHRFERGRRAASKMITRYRVNLIDTFQLPEFFAIYLLTRLKKLGTASILNRPFFISSPNFVTFTALSFYVFAARFRINFCTVYRCLFLLFLLMWSNSRALLSHVNCTATAQNNFHGQSSSTSSSSGGNSAAANTDPHLNSRTLYSSFSSPVRRDHWRVFLYHRIAPIDPVQHACYGSPLQSGVNGTFAAAPPPFGRPLMCRWQVNVRPGKNIEFRFDQSQNRPQTLVPSGFIPKTLFNSFDSHLPPTLFNTDQQQHTSAYDMQLRSGFLSRRLRILNLETNNNHETNSPPFQSTTNENVQQHCQREWIAIYDGNELLAEHRGLQQSAGGSSDGNFQTNAVCMPSSAKPKARICAGADVPETLVLESNSAVVEVCSSNTHQHQLQQQNQQHFSHRFPHQSLPPLRFGSTLFDSPQDPQHPISSPQASSSTPSLIRVTWAVNEELYLERVCNKRYTDNNAKAGVVMSPGFGVRNYPDNIVACDYEFFADPGMVFEFNTEVFNVEEPTSNGLCMFDSLTVLEKFATSQFEPVASFCGAIGPQLHTTHPHVKLRFRSDSTYNERGFIIKWNMILAPRKTLECGRSAVPPILAQAQQIKQLLPGPVLAPIVGGSEARPYSWPWQVGILTKGTNKVFCGAALIAPQWLISAAHCFYPGLPGQLRQYEVRIGEHDLMGFEGPELRIGIDRVMMNPKFDPDTVDSDISLIRLEQPVPIRSDDDSKRLICLPPRKRKLKPGTICYIVGWGETTPMDGNVREAQQQHLAVSLPTKPEVVVGVLNGTDPPQPAKLPIEVQEQSFAELLSSVAQNSSPPTLSFKTDRHRLRQAPVPILPQKICKGFFPDAITPNMFCAGYRDGAVDACQGDSGGPLVCLNENGAFEITGVTSWGFGCAQPKLPGVYVHVAHYVEWIQEVLANN